LHPETADSSYWLADFNVHQNIALRFVPQKEYARAAPLETEPAAEVVTRVFMLFRGVSTAEANDEVHWASARREVDWASVVGIDPRMEDASLLRVLEWGGMEVV
jgi:ubiquitin C